jgi:hypothetical protein
VRRTGVFVMVSRRADDHRRVGARSKCSLSSAADSRTHPGPAEILSTHNITPREWFARSGGGPESGTCQPKPISVGAISRRLRREYVAGGRSARRAPAGL